MKRLILLLATTLSVNAQNIYFPDPQLKSRLLGIGVASLQQGNPTQTTASADANQDGEISYDEAMSVFGLNLSSSGNQPVIHSIEGLQYFANLKVLIARGNSIANISQAPPLLQMMDVSKNQITAINLQQFPQLQNLVLSQNPIESLDLDELPLLRELTIRSTPITELDCRTSGILKLNCGNNPQLYYINIQNGQRWSFVTKSACPLKFDNLPSLGQLCLDAFEVADVNCSGMTTPNVTLYTLPHCAP